MEVILLQRVQNLGQIGDVVNVESETFERPPDNVDSAARALLLGVYKLKDRLLLILNTEKTIDIAAAVSQEPAD